MSVSGNDTSKTCDLAHPCAGASSAITIRGNNIVMNSVGLACGDGAGFASDETNLVSGNTEDFRQQSRANPAVRKLKLR